MYIDTFVQLITPQFYPLSNRENILTKLNNDLTTNRRIRTKQHIFDHFHIRFRFSLKTVFQTGKCVPSTADQEN